MLHVVKLGGSLLDEPERLRCWLRVVADGGGRVIVVPGGGPFAEAVRLAHRKTGVDERTAHRMALLAMEQYALLLASLEPALTPASSIGALRAVLRRGGVPVWQPWRMASDAEDIEESWRVTSDSLAAWLAREIGAAALWLVKSCAIPMQDPTQLAAAGVVDAAFPGFCAGGRYAVRVLGPNEAQRLTAALARRPVTPVPAAAP